MAYCKIIIKLLIAYHLYNNQKEMVSYKYDSFTT